jgi:hypothetical protein
MFLGRHRDRTASLEFQAKVLEKVAQSTETTSQPGQLKDVIVRLAPSADGLLL